MNAIAQPELDGLAAPVVPPPLKALLDAGTPLQLCGKAYLVRDAIVRDTTHGQVQIEALLRQRIEHHPQAVPLFAAWVIPDMGGFAPTLDYARRKAALLKAGTEVVVLGRGLETGRHHGEPVFRLLETLGISRAEDIPVHNQERSNAH